MNHVLAKIKTHEKKKLFKLLSDTTLYENIAINLDACVDYNPDHNLDEDSWFKIEEFSEKPYCEDFLKTQFVAAEFDDLPKAKFVKIAYLCAVQDGNFYFQKITPSQFLTKRLISFGEAAEIEKSNSRLVVNTMPDAIYFKDRNALVFRNLATISSVFDGVGELYKEATDQEVESFLKEPFIELQNTFDISKVSKPNRKRIGLAMDTLAKLSDKDRISMLNYVDDYCTGRLKIDKKTNTVQISNDDELKLMLYGIEQRFYTTPFGHERRLANSVQAIG